MELVEDPRRTPTRYEGVADIGEGIEEQRVFDVFASPSSRSFTPKVTNRLVSTLVWPLKNSESGPLQRENNPRAADCKSSGV